MATRKRKAGTQKKSARKSRRKVSPRDPARLSEAKLAEVNALLAMKIGRRTAYTPEIGEEIAERVAADPRPLDVLCREFEHWPGYLAIYQWEEAYPEFQQLLTVARRARADKLIHDVTSDTEKVKTDSKFGSHRVGRQRSLNGLAQATAQRLSRDWAARSQHEVAGPGGETAIPVDFSNMTTDELRDLLALQRKAAGV